MTILDIRRRLAVFFPVALAVMTVLAAMPAWSAEAAAAPSPAAEAAAPAAKADKAIVSKLTGIVLLSEPKAVAKDGALGVTGVQVSGVPFLEQGNIKAKLNGYIGQPLTEAGRAQIMADIVSYYRSQGRSVVDVSTPPQDITAGVLQIMVVEGSVGQVRVEGARWFDSKKLADKIRLKPGEALKSDDLLMDLDWINRNPFRQVDLVYAKGSELGKTDVILRATERFPLRAYLGYEDSGSALTKYDRLLAGVNWGNVFGFDGMINYQMMASPDFDKSRAHSGSFIQPLPWRHVLTVYGSYSDTKAELVAPFTMKGYSWQTSLRYEVPLPILGSYRHAAVAGFDFKKYNNTLAFGGIGVFGGTPVETAQFHLGYNASLRDPFGESSARTSGFFSPGAMTSHNKEADFQGSRAASTPRYVYGKLELNRTTGLPFDFMLVNMLTFQTADSSLLAGEQLGFGGYDSIRGYDTRVVNGDMGYIISTELRTPPARLLRLAGLDKVKDRLQFLGFLDYGRSGIRNPLPGEKRYNNLLGTGAGLRYSIAPYLTVRSDYGWQLVNPDPTASRRIAARWHIGAVLAY